MSKVVLRDMMSKLASSYVRMSDFTIAALSMEDQMMIPCRPGDDDTLNANGAMLDDNGEAPTDVLEEVVKRKRGRPPKVSKDTPVRSSSVGTDMTGKRGRGRPRKMTSDVEDAVQGESSPSSRTPVHSEEKKRKRGRPKSVPPAAPRLLTVGRSSRGRPIKYPRLDDVKKITEKKAVPTEGETPKRKRGRPPKLGATPVVKPRRLDANGLPRGRGRPRKYPLASTVEIKEKTVKTPTPTGSPPKRGRGRPRKGS